MPAWVARIATISDQNRGEIGKRLGLPPAAAKVPGLPARAALAATISDRRGLATTLRATVPNRIALVPMTRRAATTSRLAVWPMVATFDRHAKVRCEGDHHAMAADRDAWVAMTLVLRATPEGADPVRGVVLDDNSTMDPQLPSPLDGRRRAHI